MARLLRFMWFGGGGSSGLGFRVKIWVHGFGVSDLGFFWVLDLSRHWSDITLLPCCSATLCDKTSYHLNLVATVDDMNPALP